MAAAVVPAALASDLPARRSKLSHLTPLLYVKIYFFSRIIATSADGQLKTAMQTLAASSVRRFPEIATRRTQPDDFGYTQSCLLHYVQKHLKMSQ